MPFRDRAKSVRLPAGIAVHVRPGIPFTFSPERRSRSPRNRVHLRPESALNTGRLDLSRKRGRRRVKVRYGVFITVQVELRGILDDATVRRIAVARLDTIGHDIVERLLLISNQHRRPRR